MKNLNSAVARVGILKNKVFVLLVCLVSFGVAYFITSRSLEPTVNSVNSKADADIGGRHPLPGEYYFCLSFERAQKFVVDSFCKANVIAFLTEEPKGIESNCKNLSIAQIGTLSDPICLCNFMHYDGVAIGGRSSDSGMLALVLTDLSEETQLRELFTNDKKC